MHPNSVAAWIHEVELSAGSRLSLSPCPLTPPLRSGKRARSDDYNFERPLPNKKRRVALADMAANGHNRPATPTSPRKRLHSVNLDPREAGHGDLDGPTPRPHTRIPLISGFSLSYTNALAVDGDGFDSPLQSQTRSQSRPQSQSASSVRSTSPKKVTSLWDVGNGVEYKPLADPADDQRKQLGTVGIKLLDQLEDVADGPVFAARFESQLVAAGIKKIKPHHLDHADDRPTTELISELQTIQIINAFSRRCVVNRDHESEWNNRVHTKILELALGSDEARVGFRTVTATRIAPEFRPTHSPGLTTGKIVDYAMFLEPLQPARDALASLITTSFDSINHVRYEGLRTRPIAISIETKTESRSVEEAKVQLGVWLAGQVARIEALMRQVAVSEADGRFEEESTSESGTSKRRRVTSRASHSHSHTHAQLPTPTPTIDINIPDATALLSQIVFPLVDVQSDSWSLFFGRISSDTSMPTSRTQKPASRIHIFHSVPLGNTTNTVQTYRLIKSLKVLRTWVDTDFRDWWDRVLRVDCNGTLV
jgi:hypothetical protein